MCKIRTSSKLLSLPVLLQPADTSSSPRPEPQSLSCSCLHFRSGMGLLLKVFIPLLGLVLAYYFYSAPANFREGKSLNPPSGRLLARRAHTGKHRPSEGLVKAQPEKPKHGRTEGSGRGTQGSEHPVLHREAHGITLAVPGLTRSV